MSNDTKARGLGRDIRTNGRTGVDMTVIGLRGRLIRLIRSSPEEELTEAEGMAITIMFSQKP